MLRLTLQRRVGTGNVYVSAFHRAKLDETRETVKRCTDTVPTHNVFVETRCLSSRTSAFDLDRCLIYGWAVSFSLCSNAEPIREAICSGNAQAGWGVAS